MKISELIAELRRLQRLHGDLPVHVGNVAACEDIYAVEHQPESKYCLERIAIKGYL